MEEIWKDIPEYEGLYQISNLGRVKSLFGNNQKRRDKILKPALTNCGYLRTALTNHNKVCHLSIHRLVAITFIPNPEDKEQINHINGIKTDNHFKNLEWCSGSENMKHAYRIGLEKPCDNGFKKAISIKDDNGSRTYKSIREMCRSENIDRRHVQRVLHGEKSKYKKYKFHYEQN
ncbi:MAG: NUMOD4 motif-containing HNH endonuclease [Bacteroidales bacterium]|jgi:hypothetical protein|nr:NUMOD4 motif-containing HNH endonuclease [Bacteroidales bacterium]